jgi:arsenite methyltransferase
MNLQNAQDYYGKVLQGSADLATDACCTAEAPPPDVLAALANVHPEVKARYYGCGLVVPQMIEGCRLGAGCLPAGTDGRRERIGHRGGCHA